MEILLLVAIVQVKALDHIRVVDQAHTTRRPNQHNLHTLRHLLLLLQRKQVKVIGRMKGSPIRMEDVALAATAVVVEIEEQQKV